jgi:hypothetical protein
MTSSSEYSVEVVGQKDHFKEKKPEKCYLNQVININTKSHKFCRYGMKVTPYFCSLPPLNS